MIVHARFSLLCAELTEFSVAFADRDEWMADADWEDVPLEGLMEKAYIKARAALVNTTKVS